MKENKKVLIITYYWPPSGGAGVQRWLKFSKYLPEYGWDPIVFTPENPEFDLQDASLIKDVHPAIDVLKFPIWEPYKIFKKLSGTKRLKQGQVLEDEKSSLFRDLSIFIRGNLFIPDPKVFWVKPAINYLSEILKSNGIKHVVTTGPPHSMHLIGLKLKYNHPSITWISDFRDPWTQWDIMKKFKMLPIVWRKHQRQEREVLKVADLVIATGQQAAQDLVALGARKVEVLTNGFDGEVQMTARKEVMKLPVQVLHLGMLNEKRLPELFFQRLNEEISQHPDAVELNLTGILSPLVISELDNLPYLKKNTALTPSIPYAELDVVLKKADILLLLQTASEESRTQLPGKLFEYMAQRKPILAFGNPDSDVAKILRDTNSGLMLSYEDLAGISSVINEVIQGEFGKDFQYKGIEQYSRRSITSRLASILDSFQ
jgi:hypothetical protein